MQVSETPITLSGPPLQWGALGCSLVSLVLNPALLTKRKQFVNIQCLYSCLSCIMLQTKLTNVTRTMNKLFSKVNSKMLTNN